MKTLYININGENIQSTEDIIVIGRPEDAIVNKFFFELGKEILKGVVAPGVSGIKKKDIVMDFKAHDEKSFNGIMNQWETLKLELLGDNPSGTRTINLPEDYITWLQNSSQPAYAEIAKSLYNRGGKVEISLDKIYKNAIGIIVNNIEPEECKDCSQFVVNDNVVTDDSAITCSIQERMPQIAFVPFEDFGKCPKCGKKPCECKPEYSVCPKCGKNPCECLKDLFPVDDIILGNTSLSNIVQGENVDITPQPDSRRKWPVMHFWDDRYVNFSKGSIIVRQGYYEVYIEQTKFKYIQFFGTGVFTYLTTEDSDSFPKTWSDYFGFTIHSQLQHVKSVLETKRFDEQKCFRIPQDQRDKYKYMITFFIEHKKYYVSLMFGEDYEKGGLILYTLSLELVNCPYCKSNDVKINVNFHYDINMSPNPCIRHQCTSCNRRWDNLDLAIKCTDCGSYGTTYRTKKGNIKCIACGHSF